jgi:hypothetical protein
LENTSENAGSADARERASADECVDIPGGTTQGRADLKDHHRCCEHIFGWEDAKDLGEEEDEGSLREDERGGDPALLGELPSVKSTNVSLSCITHRVEV